MALKGSCHCGKTKFEIDGELPAALTRCTCSFCAKRGVLWAYYKPNQLRLLTPESDRAEYRWRTKNVAHYFCDTCGCGTYSDTPDLQPDGTWDGKTRRLGINARLFEEVNGFEAATYPVTVIDGKNGW